MPRAQIDPAAHSLHPSGYTREEAVNLLAGVYDGTELPFLLLRLNDWVPQVRTAALAAVRRRIRAEYAEQFARCFALVDRLRRAERADHAPLLAAIAHLVATPRGQAAMLRVLATGPRRTARAAAAFLIEHPPADPAPLIENGLASADPLIRIRILQLVTGDVSALQRLAQDPSPLVRREALRALVHAAPDASREVLERALLDASGIVREVALTALAIDARAFYRSAIARGATPRKLAAAIAGLGRTGVAEDAGIAAPFLTHPGASVRRAAVKCVMRLAAERFAERIAELLHDSSPAVSAAARTALRPDPPAASRLWELFLTAPSPHARRNAVHLFTELPKWQSITRLLDVAATGDEELSALAVRYVADWNRHYGRRQSAPARGEAEAVAAALARAERRLDATIAREIRFALEAFLPRPLP